MYQPMCGLQKKYSFYATEEGTFPITAFSGMTTFIMQRELNDLNEEYTKLQWYKDINTH